MPRRGFGRARRKPRTRKVRSPGARTVPQQILRRSSPTFPESQDALACLTRKDLLKLARRAGLRGRSRLKKKALARALWSLLKKPAAQTETSSPPGFPGWESAPLPESYGKDRLVLMPIDPYWVHAYWEMNPQSAPEPAPRILRVYDVTFIDFDGTNAHSSFDIEIMPQAQNWYINLWSPGKSLCAELGLVRRDGTFTPRVRSNVIQTPPAWASPNTEGRWLRVKWGAERPLPAQGPLDFEAAEPVPPPGFQDPSLPPSYATPGRASPGLPQSGQHPSLAPGFGKPEARARPAESISAEEYRRYLEETRRMMILRRDEAAPPAGAPPPVGDIANVLDLGLSSIELVKKP